MVILDAPSVPWNKQPHAGESSCTLNTAIVGVGGEPRRTELAQSLVVFDDAGGVSRALSARARILTLVLDARLAARAALVFEADLDGGVAAGGADADCLVVQHLTLFAGAADGNVVTRVLAPAAAARLVGRTVVMHPALNLPVWTGQLALLVDHQAVLAAALGLVVHHLALLVEGAGLGSTGVEALTSLGVASCVLAAISVGLAACVRFHGGLLRLERSVAGRIRATSNVRPADEALRTFTAGLVDHHLADRVVSTGSSKAARVRALASDASQAAWAVKVGLAFSFWDAGDVLYYY